MHYVETQSIFQRAIYTSTGNMLKYVEQGTLSHEHTNEILPHGVSIFSITGLDLIIHVS